MAESWKELTFQEFMVKSSVKPFLGKLLALDPGETTGYAIFDAGTLQETGQINTQEVHIGASKILALIETHKIERIVYESYRVYAWRRDEHVGSELHTPQLIGAIKLVCHLKGIEPFDQTAQIAKKFCTDDKLKIWQFWTTQKHARDAIRHGVYFLLFSWKSIEKASKKK